MTLEEAYAVLRRLERMARLHLLSAARDCVRIARQGDPLLPA
jgi:hypothetical protein